MEKLRIEFRPNYKFEDYLAWEGKWELIDGVPYSMSPSPTKKHQLVSANVGIQLNELLKNCSECQAFIALDWRINDEHDNNVFCPDNSVVCKPVTGDYIETTPELIFEILSPSTAGKDKEAKYIIYQHHGVKYYVIIDIESSTAEIFVLESGKYKNVTEENNGSFTFDLGKCRINFDFRSIWKTEK
ncbi:MAG TPA: Uma2 family endonuclease [Ignavibacteria bacterium]|nr:Uma2 family endonuclease [Bacteroidota bacterium]HRE09366.1 Uma2 family endonuclease [Ignavibacteria bacterium]HRF64492.1 Uma2 family endonuclease [Ignavibacteria bacterium]HRJ04885.1 Uma2 family endonuclease [Ignavibacteria bacterium]